MSRTRYRALLGTSALAVGAVLAVAGAATAQAAPVHPIAPTTVATGSVTAARNFPCGYDGYGGSNGNQPLYNHCGAGDVVIQVDHFFWQTTYDCVAPGVHEIDQGNSQWRIISAEYDGHTCSIPGPVVGP